MFSDDAAGRDRRHGTLSRQRSAMQLRRTGAAGAGVGRQGGAEWDHAAGFALDALGDGGSGAGGDALFSGGQALLWTAAAQETQARGAGGAGAQAADRGLRP